MWTHVGAVLACLLVSEWQIMPAGQLLLPGCHRFVSMKEEALIILIYIYIYIQGRLGNCYFLAAIASCAEGDDDVLLKDLIIEEGAEEVL